MKVREVMTRKVVVVSPTTSFAEIVRILAKEKISGVPVVGKLGKVVGVISEKDLFYRLFPSQKEFYKNIEFYMNYKNIEKSLVKVKRLKARNLMSKNVISISPDDNVLKACSLFLIHNIRRLPVLENGKLVGIVTTNNIYKNFLLSIVGKS